RREYANAVFYADDAFAGLHIMEDLATENSARDARLREGRTVKEYAKAAAVDEEIGPVFAERSPVVSDAPNIPAPPFWGVRVRKDYDLREVFRYINETALFKNQWQLKTASQSDYVRLVEEKFRPILRALEDEVAGSGLFQPQAVWGYFPAQADGNDVVVYEAEGQPSSARPDRIPSTSLRAGSDPVPHELLRFTFPRQKEGRRLCVSDFFAPKASGKMDVIGLSLVTIGPKATIETQRLFEGGEYTKYLYLHGLSVETAEALAELHHKKMREELGIAGEDAPEIRDLFHQKYRGSRFSFGYPACPNLEDQTKLFALLKPEENVGVRLTSAFLLEPEQSTSAIVVHHPGAKYFVV
ncbi:MAG TPA: vitamin B12 dependent-methionine synthase activation domain-containing protein, partial [Terriglobales bacterium]|nr:vitamin B12 dependent-methionine synthase activation domain-containing protein [Terriglobales bacterium]